MNDLENLKQKFSQNSNKYKNQLPLIDEINQQGKAGEEFFKEYLGSAINEEPNIVLGKVYRILNNNQNEANKKFLHDKFPLGIVPLKSDKNIDYKEIYLILSKL